MRTLTLTHSQIISRRMMRYVRLAFISGASTAFFCHSSVAQGTPDHSTGADDGTGKRFIYQYQNTEKKAASTVTYHAVMPSTGPSYTYNITSFIKNTLPVNTVQFSDNSAAQLDKSALELTDNANQISIQANAARNHAKQADIRWQAVALCKEADSLDILAESKRLEASKAAISAIESQYEANTTQIATYQHSTTYSTDLLTSAELLSKEAAFYYAQSLKEIATGDIANRSYLKQSYADAACKDMETAVLKQQSAENIYMGIQQNNSVSLAQRIDSILVTNEDIAAKNEANSFGNIVFCVEVGTYSRIVPMKEANKLLKLSGLGITSHTEENGVTTYTIGEYTSACSTCAAMLSEELVEDGYAKSTVITYQKGSSQEPDTRWVIAKK